MIDIKVKFKSLNSKKSFIAHLLPMKFDSFYGILQLTYLFSLLLVLCRKAALKFSVHHPYCRLCFLG